VGLSVDLFHFIMGTHTDHEGLPTMPTPNYKFIADLDEFLDRHGLSDTRAGILSVRDGHVVSRIRSGRARRSTILRFRRWMARFQLEAEA
jgi:hypothetical protein